MRNVNLLFFRVQSTEYRVQLHASVNLLFFWGGFQLYSVLCQLYSKKSCTLKRVVLCTLLSVLYYTHFSISATLGLVTSSLYFLMTSPICWLIF